jgi:ribosomal protein S18 acetylase RimI-like enzyme
MKKFTLIIITLACISAGIVVLMRIKAAPNFTIAWHEITPQNYPELQPILAPLPDVLAHAFLPIIKPHAYATDPRLAHVTQLPAEKQSAIEQSVIANITQTFHRHWQQQITEILTGLQNNELAAAYIAIAYDSSHIPLGFALFKEISISRELQKLIAITQGSREHIQDTHDEVYVDLLAVEPGIQSKGIGKALLFSVLEHCPHIKKIYLRTSSGESNKNTQGFYEHVGFTRVLTGSWQSAEELGDFGKEKTLYLYQRPQEHI